MKPIHTLVRVCAVGAGLLALLSTAQADDLGVDLKAGTLGAGVDLSVPVDQDAFNLRVNENYLQYNRNESLSDVDYDGKLKLETAGLLADWYPFHGVFRLSAGAYFNDNKVTGAGVPTASGTFNLNGTTYTQAQAGSLTGTAKFGNSVAPYAGLGWGNPVGSSGHWSIVADIGALFTGSPRISLVSSGGALSSDPAFNANLNAEAQKEQGAVNLSSVYPVVDLGLSYKF